MNNLPLLNKHKPNKLNKMILPNQIYQKVIKSINRKNIINTIIIGPNGVGKTLLLKILAKEILGEFYESACLDLNTTNHRGLKDLQTLLPVFCEKYVAHFENKKLILIDEADNLTKKAQNLITNIMNDFDKNVVFIFTCNDSRKISDSILSKCSVIYIPSIKKEELCKKLEEICYIENIFHTDEALSILADNSNGDIRVSINLLDNISTGFNIINTANTKLLLYRPSSFNISNFINLCIEKKLFEAIDCIKFLKLKGFCGSDILLSIFDYLKNSKIEEKITIPFISIIVDFYTRMSEGIDTDLQLYACTSEMTLVNNN